MLAGELIDAAWALLICPACHSNWNDKKYILVLYAKMIAIMAIMDAMPYGDNFSIC